MLFTRDEVPPRTKFRKRGTGQHIICIRFPNDRLKKCSTNVLELLAVILSVGSDVISDGGLEKANANQRKIKGETNNDCQYCYKRRQ